MVYLKTGGTQTTVGVSSTWLQTITSAVDLIHRKYLRVVSMRDLELICPHY